MTTLERLVRLRDMFDSAYVATENARDEAGCVNDGYSKEFYVFADHAIREINSALSELDEIIDDVSDDEEAA